MATMSHAPTIILQPHFANRWKVLLHGTSNEIQEQIALQITRISLDYAHKTVSFVIEQPLVGGALHQFLEGWITPPRRSDDRVYRAGGALSIMALSGNEDITYSIRLTDLECIKHEFTLDYAKSGAANHEFVMKYGSLSMEDPEKYKKG